MVNGFTASSRSDTLASWLWRLHVGHDHDGLAAHEYVQSVVGYPIFIIAVLAGGVLAGVAGYLVGAPSLRLKGDYLAIVTLSANELIRTIIRVTEVLGGPRGLGGIPKFTTLEVVFIFTTVSIVLMRNYLFSSYGRSMKAIRDSEIAAEAMGINTTRQKVFVFVFSAFFAGVSGGIFAHLLQFIHPDNFSFVKSLEYLIYLYVGGSESISGAMIGPAVFTLIPELLRGLSSGAWSFTRSCSSWS